MPRNINPLYTPPSDSLSLASSFPKVLFFSFPSFYCSLFASHLPQVKTDTVDGCSCHVGWRGIGGLLIEVSRAGYSFILNLKDKGCLFVITKALIYKCPGALSFQGVHFEQVRKLPLNTLFSPKRLIPFTLVLAINFCF